MGEQAARPNHRNGGNDIPVRGVIPLQNLAGDGEEDTALLRKMAQEAQEYLLSFNWCASIEQSYYGDGVGGIAAVFLFRIAPARPRVDEWLWVVVGDLPSAYFVTEDIKSPYHALEAYICHRFEWLEFAMRGEEPPQDVMPVNVAATPEWA